MPFPGHIEVVLLRALCRRPGVTILWDVFLPLHEALVEDRAIFAPGSLLARLIHALGEGGQSTLVLVRPFDALLVLLSTAGAFRGRALGIFAAGAVAGGVLLAVHRSVLIGELSFSAYPQERDELQRLFSGAALMELGSVMVGDAARLVAVYLIPIGGSCLPAALVGASRRHPWRTGSLLMIALFVAGYGRTLRHPEWLE